MFALAVAYGYYAVIAGYVEVTPIQDGRLPIRRQRLSDDTQRVDGCVLDFLGIAGRRAPQHPVENEHNRGEEDRCHEGENRVIKGKRDTDNHEQEDLGGDDDCAAEKCDSGGTHSLTERIGCLRRGPSLHLRQWSL